MADGVELATEWVTILPETAMLVKKLKEFKPPPIPVELQITKKSAETSAQQASKTVDKTMTAEAKKTGEHVGESLSSGVVKAEAKVKKASDTVGGAIKESIVKKSEEAGKASGEAMASGISKAKGAVTKAERSVADARRNEANIASRIEQVESNIRRYRDQTAQASKHAADLEARNNQLRANSSKEAAQEIAANERQIAQLQSQNETRATRLASAQANRERLMNTQANAASRTANMVDNLGTKEAALAAALAAQNNPLEENAKNMKAGAGAMGGMLGSLIPLGKQLLVTSGLFTGALGLGGAITSVLRTGNEFQDSMNRIQGITSATGDEMAKINEKARDLGRAVDLPATSANDAALAMLELTKAGFSVQQAMDAAKGALQLSAAADIDAAEAAKITGTSLNAFGLEATQASHVTDLLANAANKFPGEMTDFGYSLSQSGAVAKSFGISIEDTTTALGILAQAGIKSSDAGTLIKTMLLSLTDQGKPAQKAIQQLGLELYDQTGKFKGIEYVYKRLNQASKEMTEEQYQAATATLFGTDAARFSGLAAGKAAPNWDEMRKAMDGTGTAAKVADARMQGLPGALELLKNAGQSLGLTIYDAVKGPLDAIVRGIANVVLAFDDWLGSGAIPKFLKDHKEELLGAAAVLGTYAAVMGTVKLATAAWAGAQWLLNAAMDANPITLAVVAIAALVAGVIYAYKNIDWFRKAVDTAWNWIKTAFQAAVPIFKAVWDGIVTGAQWAWNMLKTAWNGIATAAQWLWNTIMKPIGEYIKAGWEAVWTAVQIAFALGKKSFEIAADAANWLWDTVMKPVIEYIKAGWGAAWDYIKTVFNLWKEGFSIVGDAAMWLWHTIFEPVWENIKAGWNAVLNFLKPIWEDIKGGISAVGDVAKGIADGIKKAWSGLVEVFKAPMHALGSILAGIPDEFLGIHLDFAGDIRSWGKTLQGLAGGGIIKGPGTGTSDSILGVGANGIPTARVSNGEGIVPEAVLQTPLGKALFALLLGGALPAFAGGGEVGRQDGLNPGAGNLKDTIKRLWPQITDIGGRRSEDGFGEHSSGNAIDIMIPNWNASSGVGLGNQIAGWLATNKEQLGLNGMIWQQKSYGYGGSFTVGKPMEDRGSPTQNHMDHIHAILGAGRGVNAASVGLPTGQLMPTTGMSASASSMLSGGTGTTRSGGYTGSGSYVVDPKKIREAEDRVTDRTRQRDLAQQRLDEFLADQKAGKNVKESTISNARDQVAKFSRELEEATSDLETVRQGEFKQSPKGKRGSKGSDGGSGEEDWTSVGKMIFSGFLEGTGLDGSLFSNPFEWPTVKSAMAGVNFLGALFSGKNQENMSGATDSASAYGFGAGDGVPGGNGLFDAGTSMLAGIGDAAGVQSMAPVADLALGGQTPQGNGPNFDLRGANLGVSPQDFQQQIGNMTSAAKRYPTLGPTG